MNFGWFDHYTSELEFSRVILHEFGHALGLIHEHQNPSANIPWNTPVVYAFYERTEGWDHATVDVNIFQRYSRSSTQYSVYDPLSIMHYAIPTTLLTDASRAVGWNTELSKTDKIFIESIYTIPPQPQKPKKPAFERGGAQTGGTYN